MARVRGWLKQNDDQYTHSKYFIIVQVAKSGTNGWYIVYRMEEDGRPSVLQSFSNKARARKWMRDYLRRRPNG